MTQSKIWICPIAGNGERTKKLGEYKPFIKILEKTIFEWFLLSVQHNISPDDEFIFITTDRYEKSFGVTDKISKIFQNNGIKNTILFKIVGYTPQGPARSVELGMTMISGRDRPIVVINADQFLVFNFPRPVDVNCYLVANIDIGESKSYIDMVGKDILGFLEKDNVSNIASAGVYIFPNRKVLEKALNYLFTSKITYNNEYYISNSLNILVGEENFQLIPAIAKFDLGTIPNIEIFENFIKAIRVK